MLCRNASGFTLLELLVVMVIIGLLAGYVGPKYFARIGKSEVKMAQAQIGALDKALEQYRLDTGHYPVEYQLPGVLQISVNEKKGLSFALGLRSILRHDPDKIMVGEIRDPETAQIAVQSALTGHLVFTTVHANNMFDVIGRFMHMGGDPYSFVSALNGILGQRLVRMNCPHCTTVDQPAPACRFRHRPADGGNDALSRGSRLRVPGRGRLC